MSKNEEILRFVIANQALEGLTVTDEEKATMIDILEGRRSIDEVVKETIAKYAVKETA